LATPFSNAVDKKIWVRSEYIVRGKGYTNWPGDQHECGVDVGILEHRSLKLQL